MDEEDVAQFAKTFTRFVHDMGARARVDESFPVKEKIDEHMGVPASDLRIVAQTFEPYDHVNVQVAIDAYLEEEGRTFELTGVTGAQRHHGSFSDLLASTHFMPFGFGAVDLSNLPTGTDETRACVQFGLYFLTDQGNPMVMLVRGPSDQGMHRMLTLEVVATQEDLARQMLARIYQLSRELSVFRGKVVSFGESQMFHQAAGPIIFHSRPVVARNDLVFPDGVLELIENEVIGIAAHRERLKASGQQVKRGVLLHGPPGCGKTLTVRYLLGQLPGYTVVLLTGSGLHMIRHACALARALQPSLVVLEDVDLVAQERIPGPSQNNPILFSLLNEMDGVEEDADVVFVLTTNRADLLEPALAARPGRVDLAVEIGLPNEEARARLIGLYGRGLDLRLGDLESVVAQTSGVAASFFKELMRRAALISSRSSEGVGRITVDDTHLTQALDELMVERSSMTRVLIGGQQAGGIEA